MQEELRRSRHRHHPRRDEYPRHARGDGPRDDPQSERRGGGLEGPLVIAPHEACEHGGDGARDGEEAEGHQGEAERGRDSDVLSEARE